jgi:hypothetical protein
MKLMEILDPLILVQEEEQDGNIYKVHLVILTWTVQPLDKEVLD